MRTRHRDRVACACWPGVAPATATFDLGDFDPTLPTFVAALIQPTGRPGPGPLHSVIAEQKGITLRFRARAQIDDHLSRSRAPGSVWDRVRNAGIIYEKHGWYSGAENEVVRVQPMPYRAVTLAVMQPDVRDINGTHALITDLTAQAVSAIRNGRIL